jgi:hypothetical protein
MLTQTVIQFWIRIWTWWQGTDVKFGVVKMKGKSNYQSKSMEDHYLHGKPLSPKFTNS